MGGGTISTSETKIESIRLQSSTYGAAIPVVYGVTRVPGNMLWYNGFQATAHTTTQRAGKGGGVKTKSTTYTYSADVAMALAEGPVLGVPRVWRGKTVQSGGYTGAQVLTATHSYTVAAGGGSVTVTNSSSWAATVAVYYTGTIDQGDGTTTGPIYLAQGTDYTVANGVYTFGAAWASVAMSIVYQYIPAGTESALAALGMTKFAGKVGQGTWSVLSSSYPTQAIPYSGIAYVAAQAYDLGSDAQVQNHSFEVQGPMAYHLGASVPDVDPALVAIDVLTNARYGAQFPAARLNVGLWSRYCRASGLLMSPALTEQSTAAEILVKLGQLTNTAPVWSAGALKMVPFGDATLTGNGATYTPYTTALYNLDDSAFLPGADDGEPVEISYKPRADAWNHVRLEYLDRSADYNVAVAEAKDQADIDAFGLRSSDVLQAHWINDAAVARQAAQLILQRSLYIRSVYKFRLPWTFALLEPMDLVTLTDSGLGLDSQAARVLRIEEAEDGELEVEAEEVPSGVSAAVLYPSQAGNGYIANYNAAPGNVSAPVIFEAPAELTTTGLEVYAAVTGTGAYWGGCSVWCSLDGVSYYNAGTVYGGARYGTITGPVSGSTLPVTILTGQLVAASSTDAAALTSLCYVGGASPEYIAHQGATLTAAQAYTLGGLVRAAYGTTASAHTTGDPFVRVDDAVGKSGPLGIDMIGKTIYFKFTSFNIYGAAEQDLADVTAYTYAITGYMAQRGPAILNYIKATNGTQLKNGVGSITLEARRVTEGTDSLLSSGSIQLYVGTTLVTAANGYGAGSNGYTGVFDSTDISGSLVVTLRDGPTGTVYGSLTLTNVTDGTNGAPGAAGAAGTSAITATVTNDAAVLMAYGDGSVISFAPAVGRLYVWNGTTDVTASATLSATATGCTGTINTATNTPVNGQPVGYYQVTAMSADTATLTLTATYSGQTIVRTFSLAKSRAGYEIVAALPSANLFAGRMVFLTTDSKLYRYTGSAWTASVPTTDLAGTVASYQLNVNDFTVLARNWNFEEGDVSWSKGTGWTVVSDATNAKSGTWVARSTATAASALRNLMQVPCQPGEAFFFEAYIKHASATGTGTYVRVTWYNAAGAELGSLNGSVVTAATTAYTRSFGSHVMPASAATARVEVVSSITAGTAYVDEVRFFRRVTAELVEANAITADKIVAGAITTDKLEAGAVTAAKIGVTQLSAIAADVGLLRTASSGSRTEIESNQIRVYDSANTLRVRIGVW